MIDLSKSNKLDFLSEYVNIFKNNIIDKNILYSFNIEQPINHIDFKSIKGYLYFEECKNKIIISISSLDKIDYDPGIKNMDQGWIYIIDNIIKILEDRIVLTEKDIYVLHSKNEFRNKRLNQLGI